jgi:hypothetical protein
VSSPLVPAHPVANYGARLDSGTRGCGPGLLDGSGRSVTAHRLDVSQSGKSRDGSESCAPPRESLKGTGLLAHVRSSLKVTGDLQSAWSLQARLLTFAVVDTCWSHRAFTYAALPSSTFQQAFEGARVSVFTL